MFVWGKDWNKSIIPCRFYEHFSVYYTFISTILHKTLKNFLSKSLIQFLLENVQVTFFKQNQALVFSDNWYTSLLYICQICQQSKKCHQLFLQILLVGYYYLSQQTIYTLSRDKWERNKMDGCKLFLLQAQKKGGRRK